MGGTLLLLNGAYTTYTEDPAELPKDKAPAAEVKGTDVGPDGKTYRVWRVDQSAVRACSRAITWSTTRASPDICNDPGIGGRMTKTASGTPIQKFNPPQPRLFATLIEGIMIQETALGLGHAGSGAGDRDATGRGLCAGVRRRRLPAAGDHAADLRRRHAPAASSTAPAGSRPMSPRPAPAP